jgi:cytochrome c biogenesis protein CcmG, thiol:disulfide interchange protein DsbE
MKRLTILFLVLFTIAGCKGRETADARKSAGPRVVGPEVGNYLAEYTATNLDGSKFDMATRRDKVVLVNVWATWCGPCRFEIPELQALHDQFKADGFEVVGISVDESGVESVKQFVDEQKMTYPVALDPEGRIANLVQTSMLPTNVLLDRDGKIVWKRAGVIVKNDRELMSAIQKAL